MTPVQSMRLEYFQMLDEVVEIDHDGAALKAASKVPLESPVFEGHFPGHPLVPGVILLETMAQASGYLLLALTRFQRMPFFANSKSANFRSFVLPGDNLSIDAKQVHAGSGYAVTSAQIMRDGEIVCDAQLMFRLVQFPVVALEQHVRAEGRRLGFLEEG